MGPGFLRPCAGGVFPCWKQPHMPPDEIRFARLWRKGKGRPAKARREGGGCAKRTQRQGRGFTPALPLVWRPLGPPNAAAPGPAHTAAIIARRYSRADIGGKQWFLPAPFLYSRRGPRLWAPAFPFLPQAEGRPFQTAFLAAGGRRPWPPAALKEGRGQEPSFPTNLGARLSTCP